MKSTREDQKPQDEKPEFPKLMEYQFEFGSFVILFTDRERGVCVWSDTSAWRAGDMADNLTPIDNGCWKPFTGKITLSND